MVAFDDMSHGGARTGVLTIGQDMLERATEPHVETGVFEWSAAIVSSVTLHVSDMKLRRACVTHLDSGGWRGFSDLGTNLDTLKM